MTALDRFWAQVQIDLLDLPRPDAVLDRLEGVDPDLHAELVRGERWMLDPARTLGELEVGWTAWLRFYRRAASLVRVDR